MRAMGASADMADAITEQVQINARSGLAVLVMFDGEDFQAVLADHGDTPADVQRIARDLLPGLIG